MTTFTADVVEFNFYPEKYAEAQSVVTAELTISIVCDWQGAINTWFSSNSDGKMYALSDGEVARRGVPGSLINSLQYTSYVKEDGGAYYICNLSDYIGASLMEAQTTKFSQSESDITLSTQVQLADSSYPVLERLSLQQILYEICTSCYAGKSFFEGDACDDGDVSIETQFTESLSALLGATMGNNDSRFNKITIDHTKVRNDLGGTNVKFDTIPYTQSQTSKLGELINANAFVPIMNRLITGGNFTDTLVDGVDNSDPSSAVSSRRFDSGTATASSGGAVVNHIDDEAALVFPVRILFADSGQTMAEGNTDLSAVADAAAQTAWDNNVDVILGVDESLTQKNDRLGPRPADTVLTGSVDNSLPSNLKKTNGNPPSSTDIQFQLNIVFKNTKANADADAALKNAIKNNAAANAAIAAKLAKDTALSAAALANVAGDSDAAVLAVAAAHADVTADFNAILAKREDLENDVNVATARRNKTQESDGEAATAESDWLIAKNTASNTWTLKKTEFEDRRADLRFAKSLPSTDPGKAKRISDVESAISTLLSTGQVNGIWTLQTASDLAETKYKAAKHFHDLSAKELTAAQKAVTAAEGKRTDYIANPQASETPVSLAVLEEDYDYANVEYVVSVLKPVIVELEDAKAKKGTDASNPLTDSNTKTELETANTIAIAEIKERHDDLVAVVTPLILKLTGAKTSEFYTKYTDLSTYHADHPWVIS